VQTGSNLRGSPGTIVPARVLWQQALSELSGPLSVVSLAGVLLPKLRAHWALRWLALTVDDAGIPEIAATTGDSPFAPGDRLSLGPTFGAGTLVIPCWFGTRQIATLVASPASDAAADTVTALQEISDRLAAVIQAMPSADEPTAAIRANKLDTLALLAAGLAHEVRNPLLVARSYVDLMGDDLAALLRTVSADGEAADRLATLQQVQAFQDETVRAIKQAMAVLGDYRTVATETPETERIDLHRFCQETMHLIRPAFGPRLQFQVTATATPWVSAQRSRLLQVLLNLLINACHAAGQAGQVQIDVSCGPRQETAVVTVGNDGDPIDPAIAKHLFEPLATAKGTAGSGLGLAVSQMLAHRLGGAITVESRPGWTSFQLTLPAITGA
jgi:signal transduction histidine kinase